MKFNDQLLLYYTSLISCSKKQRTRMFVFILIQNILYGIYSSKEQKGLLYYCFTKIQKFDLSLYSEAYFFDHLFLYQKYINLI